MYLPIGILSEIAARIAETDGVDALTNLIKSGREGVSAVNSPEVYARVKLDINHDFPWFSDPISWYHRFFNRCIDHGNPYALYVESLRLAFNVGDYDAAINILRRIRLLSPHAELMYMMLNWCTGRDECLQELLSFKARYSYQEWRQIGDVLPWHIRAIYPKDQDTLDPTWICGDFPGCWDAHRIMDGNNGERCSCCYLFFLSILIKRLS